MWGFMSEINCLNSSSKYFSSAIFPSCTLQSAATFSAHKLVRVYVHISVPFLSTIFRPNSSQPLTSRAMAVEEGEAELPQLKLDLDAFLSDTSRSCSVQSTVPEWAKTEECCMGIDEAGRGPVLGADRDQCSQDCCILSVVCVFLGPMVYGTCFCAVSKIEAVKQTGVAGIEMHVEYLRIVIWWCF